MKKSVIAAFLFVCLTLVFSFTAGAIGWATNSQLDVKYHLVPVLKDTATATPGTPNGSYDYSSLYSYAYVVAVGEDETITDTTECRNQPYYVQEGWSDYTQAQAKVRKILSSNASFRLGSNQGSITQTVKWNR